MKKTQTGLLHLAPDWTVMSDLNNKFVIPTWTVISQLRPDLFVFSITQKTCIKKTHMSLRGKRGSLAPKKI